MEASVRKPSATKRLKILKLTFFKTMQVMNYLTYKKRGLVSNGLIIVKLLDSVSHVQAPIQLLAQGIKEVIGWQFHQFCGERLLFHA